MSTEPSTTTTTTTTTTTETPAPVLSIEGRRCIVTGGSAGIGFGVAQALVEYGARVIITGRRAELVEEAVAALNRVAAQGARAVGVVADVTKREDNTRTVETAVREFGGVDVLVNNAGRGGFKPFASVTDDDLHSLFGTNVFSVVAMTQAALPELKKSSAARVLNVASIAGHRGFANAAIYSATKGAVSSLTRSLAAEFSTDAATRHITVNAISPGPFMSELLRATPEPVLNGIIENNPLKRVGDPHTEIGGILIALISSAGAYTTGQDIVIDGGRITRV